MCCRNWKAILPFILTFTFGLLSVSLLQKATYINKSQENMKSSSKFIYSDESSSGGSGRSGGCDGPKRSERLFNESLATSKESPSEVKSLKILSKPKANYTDEARQNQIEGTVRLRVMFLANGKIGSVSVVKGLDDGLDKQAIEAAKEIKFEPQKVNSLATTVSKQVDYTFMIY